MKTSQVLSKVSGIKLAFDPSWIDGCPGCPGPIFHEAIGDYIVAGLLKQIAVKFSDRSVGERMHELSKQMAYHASKGLINGWEDGDDICPPWFGPHWHGPIPVPEPNPQPWLEADKAAAINPIEVAKFSQGMSELMLAGALKHLAELTTNEAFSNEIFTIGQSVVKGASDRVYDEYCGTVPYPRPRPHYNQEFIEQ